MPIREYQRRRKNFALPGLICAAAIFSVGCWEQVSPDWFPQMKRQAAVQAYEINTFFGNGEGLSPPEGTVPVGDPYPDVANMPIMEQEQLQNPVSANLASLKNGEKLFQRYCSTCHGPEGKGDGPVAGPPFGTGPLGLVLPVGGPSSVAKVFSDGHIYTTMTLGRGRMPSYRRILPQHRWDIVNYIRDLNGQGGRQ
ncbi:MAG: cytochrome c [Myxococcota bacterium]|nr:cytochrome c [Myxococcota bacterium]